MDGRTARLGERAGPGARIEVDGRPVAPRASRVPRLLLYHKPVGELVTRRDPEGRASVFERLPPLERGRWVAVGRLDLNSSGLLLLTDSGELAARLMHPRHRVEREYLVRVLGPLGEPELRRLREGVALEDGLARFSRIEPLARAQRGPANRWYRVVLAEGRSREVRRMFEALGHRVSRLVRVRFGNFTLPRDLPPGRWIEADAAQLKAFLAAAHASG